MICWTSLRSNELWRHQHRRWCKVYRKHWWVDQGGFHHKSSSCHRWSWDRAGWHRISREAFVFSTSWGRHRGRRWRGGPHGSLRYRQQGSTGKRREDPLTHRRIWGLYGCYRGITFDLQLCHHRVSFPCTLSSRCHEDGRLWRVIVVKRLRE